MPGAVSVKFAVLLPRCNAQPNLLSKLGANDRADAVTFVMERGLFWTSSLLRTIVRGFC